MGKRRPKVKIPPMGDSAIKRAGKKIHEKAKNLYKTHAPKILEHAKNLAKGAARKVVDEGVGFLEGHAKANTPSAAHKTIERIGNKTKDFVKRKTGIA